MRPPVASSGDQSSARKTVLGYTSSVLRHLRVGWSGIKRFLEIKQSGRFFELQVGRCPVRLHVVVICNAQTLTGSWIRKHCRCRGEFCWYGPDWCRWKSAALYGGYFVHLCPLLVAVMRAHTMDTN